MTIHLPQDLETSAIRDVLLVEDDELDVKLFRHSQQKFDLHNRVFVAHSGPEALVLLDGIEMTPTSTLLLIDINLPSMDGLTLLKQIRSRSAWSTVPVFMLTSSNYERDVVDAMALGITGYLLKQDLNRILSGQSSTLRKMLQEQVSR